MDSKATKPTSGPARRPPGQGRPSPLRWSQVSRLVQEYHLEDASGQVIGEMLPTEYPLYTTTAECLGAEWELRLRHRWDGGVRAEARDLPSGRTVAEYRGEGFHEGALHVQVNHHLDWGADGEGGFRFRTRRGAVPLRFRPVRGIFRRSGSVEVGRGAWGRDDVELLVVMGWFLLLHRWSRGREDFR